MNNWHSIPTDRLLEELDARPQGLTTKQAKDRLDRYGPNALPAPKQASLLARVLAQVTDPMIVVLLAAAGLSLAVSGGKDWLDGAIILVIVVVNSVLSISQEDRAQQALEELQKLSSPMAQALRDGRPGPGQRPGPRGHHLLRGRRSGPCRCPAAVLQPPANR